MFDGADLGEGPGSWTAKKKRAVDREKEKKSKRYRALKKALGLGIVASFLEETHVMKTCPSRPVTSEQKAGFELSQKQAKSKPGTPGAP